MSRIENSQDAVEVLKQRRKMLETVKEIEQEVIMYAVERKIPGIRVDWNVLEFHISDGPRRVRVRAERMREEM